MGHMHARRSGQRSTKKRNKKTRRRRRKILFYKRMQNSELEPHRDKVLLERTRRVGAHIVAFDELKGSIATDLAGVFPIMSNQGMKYIFILYDYDTNVILASPMKSRKGEEIVRAYEDCYKQLKDTGVTILGHKPVLQYLDNEVLQLLIETSMKCQITKNVPKGTKDRESSFLRGNALALMLGRKQTWLIDVTAFDETITYRRIAFSMTSEHKFFFRNRVNCQLEIDL